MPDILAGAGIGILSTQLSYFFIDKLYGNEGDYIGLLSHVKGNGYPSYLSVKLGNAKAELSGKSEKPWAFSWLLRDMD